MSASKKPSDDFVGAMLREENVPNEVVTALLRLQLCNVDGLRRQCGSSQRRTATKLEVDYELLDAFPGKVKQVLQKMNVTLQPEHVDVLDNAAATWSNVGTQFTKKGLRDGDNSGWGFGGLFPSVPPPPTVRDIPFFGSTLSRCVRLLSLSSTDPPFIP